MGRQPKASVFLLVSRSLLLCDLWLCITGKWANAGIFITPRPGSVAKALRQGLGGGCALSSEDGDKIGQLRENFQGNCQELENSTE